MWSETQLQLIIWVALGIVFGIPVALLLLFALTRPPRETVRTEYVYRVNGEIVDEEFALAAQPMSKEDEAALARASAKAKAIFREERK